MKNVDKNARAVKSRFGDGEAEGGGLVEQLLQAAGPGPQVPEGGADRVKEAIRPSWREGAATRNRQRRRLWAGGAAAAAAMIIAALYLPTVNRVDPEPETRGIRLAMVEGSVEITPPGSIVRILDGTGTNQEISRGSLIRTLSEGRAALWLSDGQSLRIDRETEIRLDSEKSLSLDSGAVYISSTRPGTGTGIEVRTAFGTAYDIGTQFEVRFENRRLNVTVREGLVSLTRYGDEYQITHGIALSVEADGNVTTHSVSPYDEIWDWTQTIAPAFEIEGRSALAFLDWVTSETGLSLQFADAEVERRAATTLLHGSIEGLPPSSAPSAVLPTCGLIAIEEPGALLIQYLETGDP